MVCFDYTQMHMWKKRAQGRVKLLSASMKRCSTSLNRFKVLLQPASGHGIRRWRPIIGVFCLFCCTICLIIFYWLY